MALSGWLQDYQQRENAAIRRRNEFRMQMAFVNAQKRRAPAPTAAPAAQTGLTPKSRAAFEKAMEMYRPGGGFGAGVEAGLERGRVRTVASGTQRLVTAGLAGTTMAAGLGKKYEEEVAAPTRAGVESERAQRLSSLYAAMGMAEQGAVEAGAGRQLGYAQLGASQVASAGQLGLGYAQVGAGQARAAGQLGLGYAQVGAGRESAAGRLRLNIAELAAKYRPQTIPTTAPSLFGDVGGSRGPGGSGGVGVGYVPYDPELQRKISSDIRIGEQAGITARKYVR